MTSAIAKNTSTVLNTRLSGKTCGIDLLRIMTMSVEIALRPNNK